MMTLRQQKALRRCAALLLALLPSPCLAGAWLQPEGRTQIIFANTAIDAPKRFDKRGRPVRADRFSKQEMTLRAEYGFSESVTLLAGLRLQHIAVATGEGTRHHAAAGGSFGARIRLWSGGGSVLSLQGTIEAGGERSLPFGLRRMDAPAEADLRINYGHGFAIASMPAFAELQAAYRWRGGGNTDEFRLDATLGVRPLPQLLLLLQSFNTMALAKDPRFGGGRLRQHKLQPSLVWDFSERWSVQVGAFMSVAGREAIKERGAVAALWWRF